MPAAAPGGQPCQSCLSRFLQTPSVQDLTPSVRRPRGGSPDGWKLPAPGGTRGSRPGPLPHTCAPHPAFTLGPHPPMGTADAHWALTPTCPSPGSRALHPKPHPSPSPWVASLCCLPAPSRDGAPIHPAPQAAGWLSRRLLSLTLRIRPASPQPCIWDCTSPYITAHSYSLTLPHFPHFPPILTHFPPILRALCPARHATASL